MIESCDLIVLRWEQPAVDYDGRSYALDPQYDPKDGWPFWKVRDRRAYVGTPVHACDDLSSRALGHVRARGAMRRVNS